MKSINPEIIKSKIISLGKDRWWGDDFDVRFYLLENIVNIKEKIILDVGGGVGIISEELDNSNFRINLDISQSDLQLCNKANSEINNVCGSMTHLPFRDEIFDKIICSHILEVAKKMDLEKRIKPDNEFGYPTVNCTLNEIRRSLKKGGELFLTTTNNEYYRSWKLSYYELKNSLKQYFPEAKIKFFNTYLRLAGKNRKLDLANTIPKLKNYIKNKQKIINSLLKKKSQNNYSVSFYVNTKKI